MQDVQVLKIELAIKDKVIKTYHFTQDTIDIGRIPTADIFIDNSGVSRQHTRIERSIGGPYIVRDMGSTNGTYLNDIQINEATLNNGDSINLGKFSLHVHIDSGDQPRPEPASVSPDDFDGTTVLNPEQLARLRAEIVNDTADSFSRKPSGNKTVSKPKKSSDPGRGQVFLWAALIIAIMVIAFLIFK